MNIWNEKLDNLYDNSLPVWYEGAKNYKHITKYLWEAKIHLPLRKQIDITTM